MAAEHQPQSNEHQSKTDLSRELEGLKQSTEHNRPTAELETSQAEQIDLARQQIEHQTQSEPDKQEQAPSAKPPVTRLDKLAAYRHTMNSLQRQLTPASRAFSRLIHNPVVDKTSEAVGQTIMRPSVSLGATLTPLIVGGFIYLLAKRYGFPLRGSELLLLIILGGFFGAITEGLIKLLRRLRHR
jgi:hypothetical protein